MIGTMKIDTREEQPVHEPERSTGRQSGRRENPFYKKCLTLPLNTETLKSAGAVPGPDGPRVTEDISRISAVYEEFARFNREDCCGKCVPCREGTRHILELLERLQAGEMNRGDGELLLELADVIYSTALCPLGKTAASRIAGIFQGCPEEFLTGCACENEEMRHPIYRIDPALCRGCSRCARVCPAGAISGKIKEPFFIDAEKCVGCGACLATCTFKAVKEAGI